VPEAEEQSGQTEVLQLLGEAPSSYTGWNFLKKEQQRRKTNLELQVHS
jgi:hypothetical protein